MLNGITHCRVRRTLKTCLASLALLVITTSASAGHGSGRVFVRGGVYVGNGVGHCAPAPAYCQPRVVVHGDRCGCDACCTQREYARGVNRGEAAGSNQGFRDGFSGKPFCADVRDELRDNSRAYRDGYIAALGKSYRCAFEQGRAEQARACKPVVIRPRCP